MPHYSEHSRHLVAVDCIIFGFDDEGLKLLLIQRDFEPGKGSWSLMGGFLNQNESLDEAAMRILQSLTGLQNVYLEQLFTYGELERDPGERVISVAYYALINTVSLDEVAQSQHNAKWFPIKEVPDLIFDHNVMVSKAWARLKRKTRTQPIGFELLPECFTIPQLQKLYEAIFDVPFDKRNFRKKLVSMNLLKKLELKEKSGSKKGAFLYQFDKEKYDEFASQGFLFEL